MTIAAPSPDDGAMTADREESKYLLPRARLASFVRVLRANVPEHRFTGAGANRLPGADHFVTTVYFDTPSHAQLRAACADQAHNVKIRAREYYDLHGSLAELATDAAQIVRYQPWAFFEIKRRSGGRTQKQRFRLEKREVTAFFRGEHAAFSCSEQALTPELAAIVAYRRTLSEPLVPSCVVNYQRLAFQDERETLRVTVDLDIGYYAAADDLWSRAQPLVRGTFGAPRAVERDALVEIKLRSAAAPWLTELLRSAGLLPLAYSKFVRAGQVVHGIG
jgi:hypothetical protein